MFAIFGGRRINFERNFYMRGFLTHTIDTQLRWGGWRNLLKLDATGSSFIFTKESKSNKNYSTIPVNKELFNWDQVPVDG